MLIIFAIFGVAIAISLFMGLSGKIGKSHGSVCRRKIVSEKNIFAKTKLGKNMTEEHKSEKNKSKQRKSEKIVPKKLS